MLILAQDYALGIGGGTVDSPKERLRISCGEDRGNEIGVESRKLLLLVGSAIAEVCFEYIMASC
jgi:hypothetical protein